MANINISKFSSLNFEPENQKNFEDQVRYCQIVAVSDAILIQFIADSAETYAYRVVNSIGTIVQTDSFTVTALDDALNVLEVEITELPQDIYTFQIIQTTSENLLVAESSPFIVTDSIDNTTLLTYTNKINDFDTIFVTDTVRTFKFRFEGGILNRDIKYNVESESFRNQYQANRQLYQMPYKSKVLLIGSAFGVPEWIADKINYIFCCSDVSVNTIRHTRSEKNTPERVLINEGYPFSNFKIIIEIDDSQPITIVATLTRWVIVSQSCLLDANGNNTGKKSIVSGKQNKVDGVWVDVDITKTEIVTDLSTCPIPIIIIPTEQTRWVVDSTSCILDSNLVNTGQQQIVSKKQLQDPDTLEWTDTGETSTSIIQNLTDCPLPIPPPVLPRYIHYSVGRSADTLLTGASIICGNNLQMAVDSQILLDNGTYNYFYISIPTDSEILIKDSGFENITSTFSPVGFDNRDGYQGNTVYRCNDVYSTRFKMRYYITVIK